MEASDPSETLDYVVRRLTRWGRLSASGLALGCYESESQRQLAEAALKEEFAKLDIPFYQITLPEAIAAPQLIYWLQDTLNPLPDGVVSLTGWEKACPLTTPRLDWLHLLNYNRENITNLKKRQLWWVTPTLREQLTVVTPDLGRFFLVRVRLSPEPAPPPVMTTPPPPTPTPPVFLWTPTVPALLQERPEAMAALTQHLLPKGFVALSGLAGVGKTTLAAVFAQARKSDFPEGIYWVQSETTDSLEASLLELATTHTPQLIVPEQPQHSIERFLANLTERGKFLFIADNVEERTIAQRYVPLTETGSVLLTTRRPLRLPKLHLVPLECLSVPDATTLLLARAGITAPTEEEKTDAQTLAERLGGLPLALDQAGAYLETTKRPVRWYLEQYEAQGKLLRDRREAHGNPKTPQERYQIHDSIAATFALALEKLEKESPASADLMRLLAFLNPESIPESMFATGAEYLGDRLGPLATNTIEWDGVVEAARQLSLLERSKPPGYLVLHRVVQDVVKDTLDEQQKRIWVTAAVGTVRSVTPNINSIAWWQPLEISEQWQMVIDEALALSLKTIEFSWLLNAFATWRQYRGIYPKTVEYFQRALDIREAQLGAEHPSVATSLNNLAGLLETTGQYQEAEPLYKRALMIDEAIYGSEHPHVATSLNNLALLLQATGRYQEAEPLYRRALMIDEAIYESEHPHVGISLNNLAVLLQAMGRYQEAEPLYRRALDIAEAIHGAEHPHVATSLNNLADLLQATEHYQEAEPFYRKALVIRETQLGAEHPHVTTSLNNLAGLLEKTGRYQEAEQLSRKAFLILLPLLGEVHPNVKVVAQMWLSCLQSAQENQVTLTHEVPQELYKQALMIVNQSAE